MQWQLSNESVKDRPASREHLLNATPPFLDYLFRHSRLSSLWNSRLASSLSLTRTGFLWDIIYVRRSPVHSSHWTEHLISVNQQGECRKCLSEARPARHPRCKQHKDSFRVAYLYTYWHDSRILGYLLRFLAVLAPSPSPLPFFSLVTATKRFLRLSEAGWLCQYTPGIEPLILFSNPSQSLSSTVADRHRHSRHVIRTTDPLLLIKKSRGVGRHPSVMQASNSTPHILYGGSCNPIFLTITPEASLSLKIITTLFVLNMSRSCPTATARVFHRLPRFSTPTPSMALLTVVKIWLDRVAEPPKARTKSKKSL